MPMFMPQYKIVYPDVTFEDGIVIKIRILPIILKISHLDYLFIIKVIILINKYYNHF